VILVQGQEHVLCDDPASPWVELEAVIARKPDPDYNLTRLRFNYFIEGKITADSTLIQTRSQLL
jgi:hypothetical protein